MAIEQYTQIFDELTSLQESYEAVLMLHEMSSFHSDSNDSSPLPRLVSRLNLDFSRVLSKASDLGLIR